MDVVVTGGGTIAPIDDVRQITNVSTGSFSAAITEACLRAGAAVHHIHSHSAVLPFARRALVDRDAGTAEFESLRRLLDEWKGVGNRLRLVPLERGTVADYSEALRLTLIENPIRIVFLAMAVSDYEAEPLAGKISSDRGEWTLRLRPTPKVIRSVRDWSPSGYLVGFKMTSGALLDDLIGRAGESNRSNRLDLTIANDLQSLREGRHVVHLVRPGHEVETLGPREDLADQVVGRVLRWAADRL